MRYKIRHFELCFKTNTDNYSFALIVLLVLPLLLSLRLPYLSFPLGWDESVWAYIGWQTVESTANDSFEHIEVLDNKPPLVYVPFIISETVLGHGWANLRLASIVFNIFTTLSVCYSIYYVFGFTPALVVGVLESSLGALIGVEGNYLFMSEQTIKPFIALFF